MPTYTLAEIAEKINGVVSGDGTLKIRGTAEIDKASPGEITFLANPRYRSALEASHASAVIVDEKSGVEPAIPSIRVPDAYFGFLQTFLLFNPQERQLQPGIHPAAVIDETAALGESVAIAPHVYIGPGVRIGSNTQVFPNTTILDDVVIGSECVIYSGVSIRERCTIGNRVIIHCGAVIGSDGFGFAPSGGKYHKIPQIGRVVLEDDVEIGANTTIDRATMGETVVRAGTKLDNLVQIAHNVEVGADTVIAAQTGVSGSTRIGRNAMIAGQVGIVGHISIGENVRVGAQSGISKSISDGETVFGTPARPIGKAKRIEAVLNSLPDLHKKVRELERLIEELRQRQ